MKISFIICAGGRGERAQLGTNKLLAPLYGEPVIVHTVRGVRGLEGAIADNGDSLFEIVIAACPTDMPQITAICAPYGAKAVVGGATRTESVYLALKAVSGDIVLIQDGARPFTAKEQYLACIECAKAHGSAVVAMPSTDTVAIADNGVIAGVPDRDKVFAVQTPQGFLTEDIKRAYAEAVASGERFTDDGSVYSRYIKAAVICPCGSPANRKLTYREDFGFTPAVTVLGRKAGFGVDVHAFGRKADFVRLCGVSVPCDEGLIAHSDGDVAVHAVMDACLSAAGLRDIGCLFPDNDPAYKDADSCAMLARVRELLAERGLKICGISLSIQAEKPRLKDYIEAMRERLADVTGAERGDISIAAGTCEGLGFVGEGRGICAYCAATLDYIEDKQNG